MGWKRKNFLSGIRTNYQIFRFSKTIDLQSVFEKFLRPVLEVFQGHNQNSTWNYIHSSSLIGTHKWCEVITSSVSIEDAMEPFFMEVGERCVILRKHEQLPPPALSRKATLETLSRSSIVAEFIQNVDKPLTTVFL